MKTRQPAVAGRFYPSSRSKIDLQLSQILKKERRFINYDLSEFPIIGAVVPHAGYMFSAYQAIHFFEILKSSSQQFDTFVIINPNHTGYGPEVALEENDFWETPYGKVEVDKVFHGFLPFEEAAEAHQYEHSGEVILPLLQFSLDYSFKILPVTMLKQNPQNAMQIASGLIEAGKHLNKKICIIASSDFSHFVDPEEGKKLDELVVKEILNLNAEGVFKEVHDKHISVCGYGPIMTLIEYARLKIKQPKTNVLKTGHSGEVMESKEVVDYISILFHQ